MEKFLLVFQGGKARELDASSMQAHMGNWMAWRQKVISDGHFVDGNRLNPGGKLLSGKNKSVTDGPYTEGKEIVGGYFLINAKDFDEAIEIAKGCPIYDVEGSVQVRQVMKLDM
jgi:hypothetical protein